MAERPGAAPGSRGALVWLTLTLAALTAGAILLWSTDSRRGGTSPEFSVRRTDDRGAAIAFRLFARAGYTPRVWDRDFTRLISPEPGAPAPRGLLVLIAPAPQRAPSAAAMLSGGSGEGEILPHELESLDGWVRAGNVVVVFSRQDNDLYRGLGLIVDEPAGGTSGDAEPLQPGVLMQGVSKLSTQSRFGFKFGRKKPAGKTEVEEELPVAPIPVEQWIELAAKKDGGRVLAQVVSAARGAGLYVAVNDVYPIGNVGIAAADNARFVVNLGGLIPSGGTLWIDEYHKRAVDRGFVGYLRERAMSPALAYAVVLLALLIWRSTTRFGAAEPLEAAYAAGSRRDTIEYVRAVAALYQTAHMARDALTTLYGEFRRRLAVALRLDGLTNLEEVGRRYELRTGRPGIEAREVLIQTEAALSRPTLTEEEAVQLCGRLTHLEELLASRAAPKTRAGTRE